MKLKRILIACLFIVLLNGTVSANPEQLEKFRSPDIGSLNWDEMVNTVYQMELTNRGLPFLIRRLSDPSHLVRERAVMSILKFYPEQRALKALTTYFMVESNLDNRKMAASAITRIDPEYARRYFRKHLYADIDTQHIVVEKLVQLKDESVIPVLAKQLSPYARPWSLIETAERLAEFNDKRAISLVIDIHKNMYELIPDLRRKVTTLLSRFDDERIYPTLVKAYKEHVRRGISLPPTTLNATSLQAMLKVLKRTRGEKKRGILVEAIRYTQDATLETLPILEEEYFQTDDPKLKFAIITLLKNMGTDGLKALIRLNKKEPTQDLLVALKSFHSPEAIERVAMVALNRKSPLQIIALQTLSDFSQLHKAEIAKYVPELLSDPSSRIRFYTFELIRKLKLIEFIPDIQRFTQDPDPNVQNTAHFLLDVLQDKPQLILNVDSIRSHYDYKKVKRLNYQIKNVTNHPINIIIVKDVDLIESMEITRPDGTRGIFRGPHGFITTPRAEDYYTLKPGEEITGSFSYAYSHYQIGKYTARLHIIPYSQSDSFDTMTYPYPITGQTHYTIKPPTTDYVKAILDQIEADKIKNIDETYYELSELKKSGILPSLQTRALIPVKPNKIYVNSRFLKLSNTEFIEKFENLNVPITQTTANYLANIGDKSSIKILQQKVIRGNVYAALALKKLGDGTYIPWCKQLAKGMLMREGKYAPYKGAKILLSLHEVPKIDLPEHKYDNLISVPENNTTVYDDAITHPTFYERNDTLQLAAQWHQIAEKAATIDGLKQLLTHDITAVRRGAAYQLAYFNNDAGIHIIQDDLQANDSTKRYNAGRVLVKLKSKKE